MNNLSEEEKTAIVLLKELRGLYEATADEYKFRGTLDISVDEDDSDAIETILNLIEKQQKEIEELMEKNREQWAELQGTKSANKYLQEEIEELKNKYYDEKIRNTVIKRCNEIIEKDYISKDKIREKIKELEKEKEEKQEYGLDCTLIYEHEIDTNAIIRVLKELLGDEDVKI